MPGYSDTESDDKIPSYRGSKARTQPTCCSSFCNYFRLSFQYTWSDIRSRPRNFAIGVLAIFILVFVVSLILEGIAKTPYVLFRFAELNVGEMDVLILAEGSVPFANYTELEPKILQSKSVSGCCPRWLMKGEVQSMEDVKERERFLSDNPSVNASHLSPIPTLATNVILVNSELEKEIGVGRAWKYREIGFAETQMYYSALRFINVRGNVGARVRLFVDIEGTLEQQSSALEIPVFDFPNPIGFLDPDTTFGSALITFLESLPANTTNGTSNETMLDALNASTTFRVNPATLIASGIRLTVADSVKSADGKYPAFLSNMVLLDYRQLMSALSEQLCLDSAFNDILGLNTSAVTRLVETFPIEQYTLVIVAMFKDRFDTYYKEMKARQRDMIRYSNDLFVAMGIDFGGDVQYPLSLALDGFYFLQIFLNSIFTSVVAVIIVIGSLLVYMLLVTNSEERAFEVAMIRAQGMAKGQLLHLMATQAFAFVFPGILFAVGFLFLVNALIEVALSTFTEAPVRADRVSTFGVLFAVGMGIFVPVVANWGPIQSALATALRDALDIYRQSNNETKVTMMKLMEMGLEPWQTAVGWFLVISGFMIYYMVPYSFVFDELWLFFFIFNMILLAMLFGLCMVSYTLQHFIEGAILWLLLYGKETRLKTLIWKNLCTHRDRNSKTFLMFTISISCIIFGGVLFVLLARSMTASVEVWNGSDVSISSLSFDYPLNRETLEPFLEEQKGKKVVESWSFVTYELSDYPQIRRRPFISNLIGFRENQCRFVGVDPNLLDTIYPEYARLAEADGDYSYSTSLTGVKDVVRSLYEDAINVTTTNVEPVFTGWPRNVTMPNIQAKFSTVIPCVMASAVTNMYGIQSGDLGKMEFDYWTVNGVTPRLVTTVFLFQPRALFNQLSGFPQISTRESLFYGSSIIIPIPIFEKLLHPNVLDFNEEGVKEHEMQPSAKLEPMFHKIFVRLADGLSDDDRSAFVNFLQSKVNPYYHNPIDTAEIVKTISVATNLIMYFFFFVSAICIILCTFMLWLAFVSNVKLHSWNFAVLRSLGFTTNQLIRTYIYEAMCVVLSSLFVGTILGFIVAFTLVLQINVFMQLPVVFKFPWELFTLLLIMSVAAALFGSWIPSRQIASKSIASVLKKMD